MSRASKNSIPCLFVIRELFKCHEHLKTQFLARLLAPTAGWPHFRLRVRLGLTVGLAIDEAELMGREIAVGFSR